MIFYQIGGQGLPDQDPPIYATNTGVVAPLIYVTGNPRTYQKASQHIDMSTAGVLTGEVSITEAGEKLVKLASDIGSGTLAKGETLNYTDPIEVFFDGPFL